MTNSNKNAIVNSLVCQAFGVTEDQINDGTRRGDLDRWDSLGHLDLLELLQKEFEIEISPESALDMETIGDIKRIIDELSARQAS